jgi:DNA helicase-2/ATP-dependent DNA helicase PcrA
VADQEFGIPILEGDAERAVSHRGSHIQIIAAAGSGKTEVVSQRVADLIASGEPAGSIVAFTFTEKAAAELKERIAQRVTARLGDGATDQLGSLYVGTIHGYCFRLLQEFVPKFEIYTPLDSNQLTNFLYREQNRLQIKALNPTLGLFRSIAAFQASVDVIENELISIDDLPDDPFKRSLVDYYDSLDRYQFLSFGTQIVRAVESLGEPVVHTAVTSGLRHLIVDEYQDVNPAQERLIQLLAKPLGNADLVVVGDDDQAIYQWRGSNVANIVSFDERYNDVVQFNLLTNRRSRPGIVSTANAFAQSIPGRLPKAMDAHRSDAGAAVSVTIGHSDEQAEADSVASDIVALHARGVPFDDIAILVRGRNAFPKILNALEARGVPVQPGGRSGLFEQPEAAVFGATFSWMTGFDWAPGRFIERETIDFEDLVADYVRVFGVPVSDVGLLKSCLLSWQAKAKSSEPESNPDLIADFYKLLSILGVASWDLDDERQRNRLGTIARFTNVLADYESVARRARRDSDAPGEQVGGRLGDTWYYNNLALLIVNYATGNYSDFDGEEVLHGGGVALGTIHGSKGLEWPVVFLPSLTHGRFPSSRSGRPRDWLLPRGLFDAARYEGSDAEERRLFYVAMTRARDWLSISSHAKVNKRASRPSAYISEIAALVPTPSAPGGIDASGADDPVTTLSYSELESYLSCPKSFLLRNQLGFMPPVRSELGYGNAIHHVLRQVAEHARATGQTPRSDFIDSLFDTDFFLPFANKAAHKQMRASARKMILTYVADHPTDIANTWATERPFELHLPGVVVTGRADVIFHDAGGPQPTLSIVDYKSSLTNDMQPLQLQIYADAGRREGLQIDSAFVHDLSSTTRHAADLSADAIASAETTVLSAVERLRKRDFSAAPERRKCVSCDVRAVCGSG